jgi:hypothetical protein
MRVPTSGKKRGEGYGCVCIEGAQFGWRLSKFLCYFEYSLGLVQQSL